MKRKLLAALLLAALLAAALSGCSGTGESAPVSGVQSGTSAHGQGGASVPQNPTNPNADYSERLQDLGCGCYRKSAGIKDAAYDVVPMHSAGKDGLLYVRTDDGHIYDGLSCENDLLAGKPVKEALLGYGYYGYIDRDGLTHLHFVELMDDYYASDYLGTLVYAYRNGCTVTISEDASGRYYLNAYDDAGGRLQEYVNLPLTVRDLSKDTGEGYETLPTYTDFQSLWIGVTNTFGALWPTLRITLPDGSLRYGYMRPYADFISFRCADELPANVDRILAFDKDRAMYSKTGVTDKLFYQVADTLDTTAGEYSVNLPAGYSVADVKQLSFDDTVVMALFRDGSFYACKNRPAAGGIDLTKIDVLSEIGPEMVEFYRDKAADNKTVGKESFRVNFKMTDNQLYWFTVQVP